MTGAQLEHRLGPPAGTDRLYDALCMGVLVFFLCAALMVPVGLVAAAATLLGYATGSDAWECVRGFGVFVVAMYLCGLGVARRAKRWRRRQAAEPSDG